MVVLWSPLDVLLVVFINALSCSRRPPQAGENNFDQVLSEHVVNPYDSLAKWKTAGTM